MDTVIEKIVKENQRPFYSHCISEETYSFDPSRTHVIGFFLGEGIGPEVVPVAMECLDVLRQHSKRVFDIRQGGLIGYPAIAECGSSLSPQVIDFTSKIFAEQGALFCGPGGERFVYEIRKEFGLFCKFTPIEPLHELSQAGVLKQGVLDGVNIVAVRENAGGIYQGTWSTEDNGNGGKIARHQFLYTDEMVQNILAVAMKLAKTRRNRVHVVLKPGGIPSITQLWRSFAEALAAEYGVEMIEFEIDNAAYQLIANPAQFDVVVSPNLFGDILADAGSVLLASRGLSFSGNFNAQGNAVYQTGHGAARDIAGKGIANPMAQVLSLGMMLRESFSWPEADAILRASIRKTLADGYCTHDVVMPEHEVLGTNDFSRILISNLKNILSDSEI